MTADAFGGGDGDGDGVSRSMNNTYLDRPTYKHRNIFFYCYCLSPNRMKVILKHKAFRFARLVMYPHIYSILAFVAFDGSLFLRAHSIALNMYTKLLFA